MDKDLSDISLSIVNLYEDLIDYLAENKKIKISRIPLLKNIRLNKSIKENNMSYERFNEFIRYFEYILKRRFPEELLNNFYDNVSDFKIYSVCFQLGDFLKKRERYAGRYNPVSNTIIINIKDGECFYSIYHELFHMASTNRMITDRVQSGFLVNHNGMSVGKGLNEGYTDLLAYRYFSHAGLKVGYPLEYRYAKVLEQVVGQETMEKLYITSNPNGLVHGLLKYDSMDNIIDFVKLLDNVNNMNNNENETAISVRYNILTKYLIKWLIRKTIMNGENLFDPVVRRKIISLAWEIPSNICLPNSKVIKIDINRILDETVEEVIQENSMNYRRY